MEFILDDKESEQQFLQLLKVIQSRKNGDVAEAMSRKGLNYKLNWGVSIIELRQIAADLQPDHLLALKLWNKQWRETMILATLLDNPEEVNESQMDFWTKSFLNTEIAEQASTNLWCKTKYAFIKSLEWCRGKKHLIRYTGIHLMGRLAMTDKKAIDEMFEPFFEEIPTLAKDPQMKTVLYRALIALGSRSQNLNRQSIDLSRNLQLSSWENTIALGELLFEELAADYIQDRFNQ